VPLSDGTPLALPGTAAVPPPHLQLRCACPGCTLLGPEPVVRPGEPGRGPAPGWIRHPGALAPLLDPGACQRLGAAQRMVLGVPFCATLDTALGIHEGKGCLPSGRVPGTAGVSAAGRGHLVEVGVSKGVPGAVQGTWASGRGRASWKEGGGR